MAYRFAEVVTLDGVNPIPNAGGLILSQSTNTTATLYADPTLTETIANPVTTGPDGWLTFYSPESSVDFIDLNGDRHSIHLSYYYPIYEPVHAGSAEQALGAPTAAKVAAGVGGSAPNPILTGSNGVGLVTWGTGANPTAAPGNQVTVTFSQAYGVAPSAVIISPRTAATALLGPYVGAIATTSFTVALASDPTDSQGNTVYGVYYWVIP